MKTTKILFWLAVIIIGIIVLVYLARKAIDSNTVPSLSELIASSTSSSDNSKGSVDQVVGPTFKDGTTLDIKAPRGTIHTTVSSGEASQEKGLSGEKSLPADGGMLFEFPEASDYGFWMKDMLFPIDIIWIGEDKQVKSIDANVSPDTYPNAFYPSEPILYVLELNAGSAEKTGIQIGTKLEF